jgi:hypothetical protein
MSSEHWFDALAHPHTRRSALRTALGGTVALAFARLPSAWAAPGEPCYVPCVASAQKSWDTAQRFCGGAHVFQTVQSVGAFLLGNPVLGAVTSALNRAGEGACVASAELTFHRSILACKGSECGNAEKYPGGVAPGTPKEPCADPTTQVRCGDVCCDVGGGIAQCCHCGGGKDVCFRVGDCEPACRG